MSHFDSFLKIDGIEGESLQKGHEKEIEITGFTWTAQNAGSFAGNLGGGSGKVKMRDFKFSVPTSKATPKLFLACCTGEHIKSATLTCRKAGKNQQEYLKWKFTDLLISSYVTGAGSPFLKQRIGSAGGESGSYFDKTLGISTFEPNNDTPIPTDEVTFNFTRVEVAYAPQKADGSLGPSIPAGFDLKTGTKV